MNGLEKKIIQCVENPYVRGVVTIGLLVGAVATIWGFYNTYKNRQMVALDFELKKLQIELAKKQLQQA